MNNHLIIGGGINGLLTAHYLLEAGEKATIIEKGQVGKESSWAGGGILSPLYPWRYPQAVTQLVQWSQNQYPVLVKTLLEATGTDPELLQSGLLILDQDDITPALKWSLLTHTPVEKIERRRIRQMVPHLASLSLPDEAIWMPQIGQIRNPRFVQTLKNHLLTRGLTIMENTEVKDLITHNTQIIGIRTDKTTIESASVAVTCGAWTDTLISKQKISANIEPVKGQMILFKTRPELIKPIILAQGHYAIPRKDGRVLFGSTLEYVGFDKSTSRQVYHQLFELACNLLPILAEYPVEHHWAGLRPGTKTSVPTIGEHPQVRGLYVNAGQFRNGVVMAPGSSRLLVDLMLKRKPLLDPAPYQFECAHKI